MDPPWHGPRNVWDVTCDVDCLVQFKRSTLARDTRSTEDQGGGQIPFPSTVMESSELSSAAWMSSQGGLEVPKATLQSSKERPHLVSRGTELESSDMSSATWWSSQLLGAMSMTRVAWRDTATNRASLLFLSLSLFFSFSFFLSRMALKRLW